MILKLSKYTKGIALYLAINMLFQIFAPTVSMALTSGPSQPEVQSFEPVTTNQMVDPFTGDFTYNIPLFNLPGPDGGYPFNLAYHSGIGMDQEASWVGLGWSLNPGVINRDVRNLPDDFDGTDEITIKEDLKTNWTVGVSGGVDGEAFGYEPAKGAKDAIPGAGTIGLSQKVYYNSYKGVGLGIGGGLSHRIAGTGASVGLNLSLDTQEGVGASPSLSIQSKTGKNGRNFSTSISAGYNSRIGLTQTSFGISTSKNEYAKFGIIGMGGSIEKIGAKRIGGNSSIAVANNSYSPAVSTAFIGKNINIAFKNGVDVSGLLGSWSTGGFYNSQKLKDKNKAVNYHAVGYLHLEEYNPKHEERALSDIGREKDGMVHRTSELLASPSFTHDAYTVLGQGIGNTYRPFRSDLGIGTNQFMESKTKGGNIGFEQGIPLPTVHHGAEIGYNWSKTTSGKWKDGLDLVSDKIGFENQQDNNDFEPYYFKSYGEHTIDDNSPHPMLESEEPIYFNLSKDGSGIGKSFEATAQIKSKTTSGYITTSDNKRSTRRPKGVNLVPVTNDELLSGTNEILPEYAIKYHTFGAEQNITQLSDLSRDITKENHIAGYTALNNSGQRYVYGLPAYNKTKKEVRFSLDPQGALAREGSKNVDIPIDGNDEIDYKHKGTDKRFYEMTTPDYAHSYLLTSILGADYVDIDNNGPSDNDLGYWVKFNYTKTSDNYKWRAPFSGANFIEGYKTSTTDDQGAYVYGEKEIWHIGTVETKTHVAEFTLENRLDGKGVNAEIQNDDNSGAISHQLDKIDIYTKSERYNSDGSINYNAVPIKTVHFEYTNNLCKGVPNSTLGEGKLTLKHLWFTYKNNNRGELNKYTFDYNEENPLDLSNNPSYNETEVDKWGNYQPNHSNYKNQDNPYTHQFYDYNNGETYQNFVEEQNRRAGVWNLKSIQLPSGGRMDIKYEADRYAYIQDEIAMQMTPLTGVNWVGGSTINCNDCPQNQRRVYFKLKHPVNDLEGLSEEDYVQKYYIKNGEDVYFKIKTKLTNPIADLQEYVGGYAKVLKCGLEDHNSSTYTDGWVELDFLTVGTARGGSKKIKYHPFQHAAWQHIRTNQPNLMYEVGNSLKKKDKLTKVQSATFAKSLGSIGPEIARIFKGVYKWMYKKGWGSEIKLNESFLRLRTPDKEKFGGGCRVKEISITDNWDSSTTNETSESYGQRYFYTTQENGKIISSGVAAYEPVIGGDEIALRKPVPYALHTPLKTANSMYSELPVNENLYPGPQVGYSKVTVMSINTDNQRIATNPETNSTTGKVVNEYYTAKDFPVKTDYTKLDFNGRKTKMKHHLVIPVPGIGSTTLNKLAATQGYSIVLNDMHGKMKSVTNFGQDDNGNFVESKPVSSVQYVYQTDQYGDLDNKVTVINTDNAALADADIETTKEMGVDIDFITDMRRNMTISGNAGVSMNFKAIGFLPAFFPWPSIAYNESQLKTVVTNKVIHKSGILLKTIATDGQSVVETENLKFDPLTGEALLTRTTNNFDEGIYNYSMPARWGYEGMGAAYENIGLTFTGTLVDVGNGLYTVNSLSTNVKDMLQPGDEFIGEKGNTKSKFTYVSNHNGTITFQPVGSVTAGSYDFQVVRSGKRNHLGVKAANYVTLAEDPTVNRAIVNCVESTPVLIVNKLGEEGSNNRNIASSKINNVLSASATTFTNQWIKDFSDYREDGTSNYTASTNPNPFATGEKGIWSALKTYTYVDDRKQTPNVNLTNDGVFDDVSLYNWDYSTLENCNSKWKMGSEITKLNPYSLETENRDILGRYSAALYGYGGRQATAVAANAKYTEIGFEGFEEYAENQTINQFNTTTGNLSFYNSYATSGGPNNNGEVIVQEQFDVLLGQSSVAVLDASLADFNRLGISVGDQINLIASADKGTNGQEAEQVLKKVTVTAFEEIQNIASKFDGKMVIGYSGNDLFENNIGRIWTGKAGVYKTIAVPNVLANTIGITSYKSHSGSHALQVQGPVTFQQAYLGLIPGKKYELSTWVSKVHEHYTTIAGMVVLEVKFRNNTGTLLGSVTSTNSDFKGKLIEGWQKLDMQFIPPVGTTIIELQLHSGTYETLHEGANPISTAFFDDIRIFPSTGLMRSHVYDPVDLKLRATLDDNNYATFYYYDESGALFLVKQETAEGIKTIQESRGYIQEQ